MALSRRSSTLRRCSLSLQLVPSTRYLIFVSLSLKKNYSVSIQEGIRLFDCTFFPTQYPDYRRFKEESYGKFPELIAAGSRYSFLYYLFLLHFLHYWFMREYFSAYSAYAAAHIPGAVHCTQGIATYPSRYERFTYYPADIFEQYIQLLGVHKLDYFIYYKLSESILYLVSSFYDYIQGWAHYRVWSWPTRRHALRWQSRLDTQG